MKFSSITNGFYDEAIHGSITLELPDPAWMRPTKQVPQDDGKGGTLIIDVPDEDAVHPVITVPNPDCKIPVDAVEITQVEHVALLEAQSTGKIIQADKNGKPVAVDPPPPTVEQLAAGVRTERDSKIAAIGWRYERNARELRLSLKPTDDISVLDTYVQALANVPEQAGFPQKINWPETP